MQRIDSPTRAVDLFGAGKDGFRDGTPPSALAPTDLNAAWFNAVQEEICNAITGAGITLNPASRAQLSAAISAVVAIIGSVVSGRVVLTHGVTAVATDANGHGGVLTGIGNGEGLTAQGGDGGAGNGIVSTGGANAHGVVGRGGTGNGIGVAGDGSGTQPGGAFTAFGTGHGLDAQGGGGGTGYGVLATGGASSHGVVGNGGITGNGRGGSFTGTGTEAGVMSTGGASAGSGVKAVGGAGGYGGELTGGSGSAGLAVTGGTGNTVGGYLTGVGTGSGVKGTGGATDGVGVEALAGGSAGIAVKATGYYGVQVDATEKGVLVTMGGTATSAGVEITHGGSGYGLYIAPNSSRPAIHLQGQAPGTTAAGDIWYDGTNFKCRTAAGVVTLA